MNIQIPDNGGRRFGLNRRSTSYFAHIPERRSGIDRRSGRDRRIAALKALSVLLERRMCFIKLYMNKYREECL